MTDPLSGTENALPIMLLRAREAVMKRFRPMLRRHGLSEQQWRVLRVLQERGPLAPTPLAEHCVILMPSLTRILANLQNRALLARKQQQGDRRRTVVELSSAGKQLIAQITPESAEIYEEIEANFGGAESRELVDTLQRLSKI